MVSRRRGRSLWDTRGTALEVIFEILEQVLEILLQTDRLAVHTRDCSLGNKGSLRDGDGRYWLAVSWGRGGRSGVAWYWLINFGNWFRFGV